MTTTGEQEERLIERTIIGQAENQADAHVISLTLTEEIGLAAFERAGWLWIVLDKPGIDVPPLFSALNRDQYEPFEKVEINGGVAYRTKLPEDTLPFTYGEGGGLLWRIVMTSRDREIDPQPMERSVETRDEVRNGAISWPLKNTTKILEFTDPAVGDVIRVVTVEDSSQFAGPARRLVDFDVFDSYVGLAIYPKVENLRMEMTISGVKVYRPDGACAVSPA